MSKSLAEWIKEITEWQDSIFTQATPKSAAIHLKREAIEVLDSICHHDSVGLDFELVDVLLLTIGVAHLSGINLEEALDLKMFHNRNRAWGKPDADGVVEHIREQPPMYEGNDPRWKGKTLIEVFTDEGLIPQAPSGFENVLIIKSSAENGGKISNSPNTIN